MRAVLPVHAVTASNQCGAPFVVLGRKFFPGAFLLGFGGEIDTATLLIGADLVVNAPDFGIAMNGCGGAGGSGATTAVIRALTYAEPFVATKTTFVISTQFVRSIDVSM